MKSPDEYPIERSESVIIGGVNAGRLDLELAYKESKELKTAEEDPGAYISEVKRYNDSDNVETIDDAIEFIDQQLERDAVGRDAIKNAALEYAEKIDEEGRKERPGYVKPPNFDRIAQEVQEEYDNYVFYLGYARQNGLDTTLRYPDLIDKCRKLIEQRKEAKQKEQLEKTAKNFGIDSEGKDNPQLSEEILDAKFVDIAKEFDVDTKDKSTQDIRVELTEKANAIDWADKDTRSPEDVLAVLAEARENQKSTS